MSLLIKKAQLLAHLIIRFFQNLLWKAWGFKCVISGLFMSIKNKTFYMRNYLERAHFKHASSLSYCLSSPTDVQICGPIVFCGVVQLLWPWGMVTFPPEYGGLTPEREFICLSKTGSKHVAWTGAHSSFTFASYMSRHRPMSPVLEPFFHKGATTVVCWCHRPAPGVSSHACFSWGDFHMYIFQCCSYIILE